MSTSISTSHGTLVIDTCCQCKTPFAMSQAVFDVMIERREKGTFYCPNGHPQHYASGESDLDKMRRERDRLAQQVAYKDDLIRAERENAQAAERRLSAAKGRITKIKNRVGNGVCPCCNRTFSNLARHMASEHVGYTQQEDVS